MGYSDENVLYLSDRYSGRGIESIGYRVALYPMKSPYTPIPRYQCNESKPNSLKWSEMQVLELGRTFQPVVVLIYVYKNMYPPVPFARLHVWVVQAPTLRSFSGYVALTSRNASQ